MEHFQHQEVGK